MDRRFSWKHLIRWILIGLALFILAITINQVLIVYDRLSIIHPILGVIVASILGVGMLGLMIAPIIGFMRLRKPLELPESKDDGMYQSYLMALSSRMERNPYLKQQGFTIDREKGLEDQIEEANKILAKEAEDLTKKTAGKVFLSTAISQNGSLDSIFVLYHLARLVWRISKIYNQRPSLKRIAYLYGNIGATVLMARELEDMDLLAEQLEPVIQSMVGSSVGSFIPGATTITTVLISSIVQGSTNAFLTLRVGLMAATYSGAVIKADQKLIRRSATAGALVLLAKIVQENTVSLVKSFAKATKKATIDKTVDSVKTNSSKLGAAIKDFFTPRYE